MMKLFVFLIAITILTSCKKNNPIVDNGCISQINVLSFSMPMADSITAVQLLKQNHLPTDDLQVEYIIQHDTTTVNGVAGVYQYIYAVQYLKGIPILSSDFGYLFKEGIFKQIEGARFTNIDLDTHPKQPLPQLRSLFLDQVNKKMGANGLAALKNSCLVAQFGYYDLNARSAVPNHTPNFVMAWSITPKYKQFPNVLIRDDNEALIAYY
jgi:hypothetical protein